MARTNSRVDQIRTEAVKPLFAVAGATDLAVDRARGYATQAQKKAQKSAQERLDAVQARVARVTSIQRDPKALQGQARDALSARLEELQKEARDAQSRFEARLAELQKDARDFPGRVQSQLADAVEELVATYAGLADRGEKFVAALRKDGVRAVTAVRKAPSKSTTVRRERAVTASRKPAATKPATKKASKPASKPAGKPAAKKASTTVKKSTATKTTARKSAASKAPAKKAATTVTSTTTSTTTTKA
jgi:hypothetical protein